MEEFVGRVRGVLRAVRENQLTRVAVVLLCIVIAVAAGVYTIEHVSGNKEFRSVGDALWWAFVTMSTVGYGDITPVNPFGRALALVVIFSGIGLSALFTAAVASYLVEKRILEGKGMEEIKFKKHIIICGWNSRAMGVIERIAADKSKSPPLVLVNELPEEHIANILRAIKGVHAKYVRGDYVHEGVLKRANAAEADVVVFLLDTHASRPEIRPDDRTVLAAFTARDLNPKVRICAEVENPESVPHLKRAGVQTVVLLGGHNSFLLANAAINPGITLAIEELLSCDQGNLIQQRPFPHTLVDKRFGDAFAHFRRHDGHLLIGIAREEEEGMNLDDILSGDMSAIDRFIKKKFEGLEKTYFTKKRRLVVNLNPPDDYVIKSTDLALLITSGEKRV